MKNICILLSIMFIIGFNACQEENRFEISGNDKIAPGPPKYISSKSLVGGARIFYNIPDEEDVLSINAEYVNKSGVKSIFSASYFLDSIDVMGIADTLEHVVNLYSVDRAGNTSVPVPVTVKASESALQNVSESIQVLAGFNSIIISWVNELEEPVNVYIDMTFNKAGKNNEISWVLTSNKINNREIVDNINLSENESLSVNIHIGDSYGNRSEVIKMGQIHVMSDEILPKDFWTIPNTNDSIAGIPMCFGNAYEAKAVNVIDGITSRGEIINIMHTAGRGRTGNSVDGNTPWNFIIDLGDYYELSRIVTNQRHDLNTTTYDPNERGIYYTGENVNQYNMYYLNDETGEWEFISQHTIEVPSGLSSLEMARLGAAGDMALMYPEVPRYTKPTRWFRYEAISGFGSTPLVLSEITLYGRKATIQ